MRRSKREAREAKLLTREALDIGHASVDITRETISQGREALEVAKGAIALAGMFSEKVNALPHGEVLNADELRMFAEAVPQWSVSSGISDGRPYKSYSRNISADELVPERRAGGELEHETYLRLADGEYSDYGLARIFDTYSFSGDAINGNNYHITIHSDDDGPLTYIDYARVLDAEAYLISEGYILPPAVETVDINAQPAQ